jgi:hypothetical protein
MFQKSIAIYLAVFLGVGIDPGCCLRAWISNAAVSVLSAPFQYGLAQFRCDPAHQGPSCCRKSCCVELNEASSGSEDAKASTKKSCCVVSGACCTHQANGNRQDLCEWNGADDCECELTKPLDSFSLDVAVWSPVLLHLWFSEPIELPAGVIPAISLGEKVCSASPPERLAELCRWNC